MNTRKKGNILETVVSIVEKAMQTNPDTKIFLRYKIADRHGKMREHDVYVETNVNGKLLKYSFECKHFGSNSSVKMSHIAEYYDKLQETAIKGFFISNGKFQKNAIEKAKNLGIDIYSIIEPIEKNEITMYTVKLWCEPGPQKIYILKPEHQELLQPNKRIASLFWGPTKIMFSLNDYTDKILLPQIRNYVYRKSKTLFANFLIDIEKSVRESKKETTAVVLNTFDTTYYQYKGEYHLLTGAGAQLFLSCETGKESTLKHNVIINLSSGVELVNYWSESHSEPREIYVVQSQGNQIKVFIVNSQNLKSNEQIDFSYE